MLGVQLSTVHSRRLEACVSLGKLHSPRVLPKEGYGKPFMSTLYLSNPGEKSPNPQISLCSWKNLRSYLLIVGESEIELMRKIS